MIRMTGMDRLSILISSYNRGDIIGRSIDSILSSNLPDGLELEIVIVDDRSDEETWRIIESYREDPRFIIHRNDQRIGMGGPNWNKAFELSTGNIVTNNEDDMIWHRDYIGILYRELKKYDPYTCVVGMYIQSPDPDDLKPPKTRPRDPYPDFGIFTGIPKKKSMIPTEHVCHNQFFCRREFFDGLKELWPTLVKGSGLREEDDLFLRTLKLVPQRKYVAVPSAYLWHVYLSDGGYHREKLIRSKRAKESHEMFLKRNFGKRALPMILCFRIYMVQRRFRDLVGTRVLDRFFRKGKKV
ncbi:MAG: glycosyltransferase family 2 protein [Thermoplasmatota archaeon]